MKITSSCDIRAPQEEVFDLFTDLEHLAQHVQAITLVKVLTDGAIGIGTRFEETRVMFGKEASETMEVTAFERPNRLVEEAHSGGMHYTSVWTFTESGGTTTVTIAFEGVAQTFAGKVLGLVFSFMKNSMKKAFEADVNDLKKVAESAPA